MTYNKELWRNMAVKYILKYKENVNDKWKYSVTLQEVDKKF